MGSVKSAPQPTLIPKKSEPTPQVSWDEEKWLDWEKIVTENLEDRYEIKRPPPPITLGQVVLPLSQSLRGYVASRQH
jgi:hypothetical protein